MRLALELAACSGARVTVCHLVAGGDDEPIDARDALLRDLAGDSAAARCGAATRELALRCAPGVAVTSCVARVRAAGDVLDLLRAAHPDLAVVAAPRRRGLRWLRRLLIPDTTDVLVDESPCPVLVTRP